MSTTPRGKSAKIAWYRGKIQQWTDNAAAIGLEATEVTALEALVDGAQAKLDDQVLAQNAARLAVGSCTSAVATMHREGAKLTKKIRAFATTGGDDVYILAGLPIPTPDPVAAPGTPYDFKADLKPNGTLGLVWKCDNPAGANGTFYHVFRRNESGQWIFICAVGERKFTDTTVPAGVPSVHYQVQAARTTAVGDAAEFIVNFGVVPTGTATATVAATGADAPKMAA